MHDLPVSPLIGELCAELSRTGIEYCHWKSNVNLTRAASGESDLDLLVARSSASRFFDVLARLRFKEAAPREGRRLPGIRSYYAFDERTGRFVHVHAHFQLIIGHDLAKNYHLPIERHILESSRETHLLPVPSRELELLVFVIRATLKFSILDALARRSARLSRSASRELEFLLAEADRDRVASELERCLPVVDDETFDLCLRALLEGGVWLRRMARARLEACLAPFRLEHPALNRVTKLRNRVADLVRRRVFKMPTGKLLVSGGAIVAFIGGDGAGKSTAVKAVYEWLSPVFATMRVHLGRPPRSKRTLLLDLLLRAVRPFLRKPSWDRRGGERDGRRARIGVAELLWLTRRVCLARDRYRAFARARRFATNGGIVVCDRFPIPQLRLMDGPQASYVCDSRSAGRLTRYLMRAEEAYYEKFLPPEVLIVLRVDPDVAVRRKIDEPPDTVRARCREVWEADWSDVPAHIIDASSPADEVFRQIRSVVWREV